MNIQKFNYFVARQKMLAAEREAIQINQKKKSNNFGTQSCGGTPTVTSAMFIHTCTHTHMHFYINCKRAASELSIQLSIGFTHSFSAT